MIYQIILFIIAGGAAGFLAGLLGIGGGLLVVPFLAFALPRLGMPAEIVMHMAIATSLTLIVFTSASSVFAHYRQGGVLWDVIKSLLPAIILGALLGAVVADFLRSSYLRIIFGLFVWYMAYNIGLQKSPVYKEISMPKRNKLRFHGMLISGFCTILGTGGGSLFVPYFSYHGTPIRNAVATSAACGLPLALTGMIGLMLVGWNESANLPGTFGYVYLPALAAMIVPSVLLAPLGAKVAHMISVTLLRRIFAIFLLLVGIDMLWKAIGDFIEFI